MAVVCPKLHVNDRDVTYRLIHCALTEKGGEKLKVRKEERG
jgi:hypothetical protein